ncbi:hypothetical protein KR044_007697 [Drosophila immigrans]|nr:hypothetical protein KR044_007697 [Drosophila immigrans]
MKFSILTLFGLVLVVACLMSPASAGGNPESSTEVTDSTTCEDDATTNKKKICLFDSLTSVATKLCTVLFTQPCLSFGDIVFGPIIRQAQKNCLGIVTNIINKQKLNCGIA